jgi:hypothetical protein
MASSANSTPEAELFRRFQESMRIVFVTGERDEFTRDADAVSPVSLRDWGALWRHDRGGPAAPASRALERKRATRSRRLARASSQYLAASIRQTTASP